MISSLYKSSIRFYLQHRWQPLLAIIGIALGVSVVVSIDLAKTSANQSFERSTQSIAGRTTHQIFGGPGGVAESLYARLRVKYGNGSIAPVIQSKILIPEGNSDGDPEDEQYQRLTLLGLDPFAERGFRHYVIAGDAESTQTSGSGELDLSRFLTEPNTVIMGESLADELGLKLEDKFDVLINGRQHLLQLIGFIPSGDEVMDQVMELALQELIVTDIATAQELFGMVGFLSRIDLVIDDSLAAKNTLEEIRALLPDDAEIINASTSKDNIKSMTDAFHTNLTALSLLALLVGMFLIFNTVSFFVVQRRTVFGRLRALGVTRRELFQLILIEALIVGSLGTLLGSGMGILLGQGMLGLLSQTTNDLYYSLHAEQLTVTPAALIKAIALGMGATLFAALAPAFEAARTTPRRALERSEFELAMQKLTPHLSIAGGLCIVAGITLCLLPFKNITLGFTGLFFIIVGMALFTPALLTLAMGFLAPLLGRVFGVMGQLAARSVVASLSRTAVAIAALSVAVATTIGIGLMIDSFRHSVADWLDTLMQADIYLSVPGTDATGNSPALEPTLRKTLLALPQVEAISSVRRTRIQSEAELTSVVAYELNAQSYKGFRFSSGEAENIWQQFENNDAVIITEPYAYHHNVKVGEQIDLRTDRGRRSFPVAGIYSDYGSEQGVVALSRQTYEKYWDDRAYSGFGLYLGPDVNVDEMKDSINEIIGQDGQRQRIDVTSNRAVREASLKVFDRTFAITEVMRVLAAFIAFAGIFSALMALQLERRRELGVLRATGVTPRQLWLLVVSESGLMGLFAGLMAIPLGTIISLILITVINRRSFGWTMDFHIADHILSQGLMLAIIAALIAAIYPAYKMAGTSPAEALRLE